jgi:hypothetical protein
MPGLCVLPSVLRERAIFQRVQQYGFAGQVFEFVTEPADFRTGGSCARPGGADVDQDVV